MIALLVLLLSHEALRDLDQVARFADRIELRVERGTLTDGEVGALLRWPGLVVVDLRLPLGKVEAAQLRKLPRLAVHVASRDASLKLLGPSLVRVDLDRVNHAPAATLAPEPVCAGTLRGEVLELKALDACAVRWLEGRLDPHPESPEPPQRR